MAIEGASLHIKTSSPKFPSAFYVAAPCINRLSNASRKSTPKSLPAKFRGNKATLL